MGTEKINGIIRYDTEDNIIASYAGILSYRKVTPVFGTLSNDMNPVPGSCFLYEDYSSCLKPGDVFYEIRLLKIFEENRRQGEGTKLVKKFFEQCKPQSVVIEAGITSKKLYDELAAQNKEFEYIEQNIRPFWESLGFTDVNNTTFCFENHIPMLWPMEKVEEVRNKAEEFKRRLEQTLDT